MPIYAHTKGENCQEWQLLCDHLNQTAQIAHEFEKAVDGKRAPSDSKNISYAAGLLHDIGKYSNEFQGRLLNIKGRPVNHSSAGAIVARESYKEGISTILAYMITGHHGGLLDYGSEEEGLYSRLNPRSIPDFSDYRSEVVVPDLDGFKIEKTPTQGHVGFCTAFYIKMLFSCLVDADRLDTERFCDEQKACLRSRPCLTIPEMQNIFDKYMSHRFGGSSSNYESPINVTRKHILDSCIAKSSLPSGIFKLTVPTGCGKTLSSMAFALNHAVSNSLDRIIYAIPYTSVIEQNAQVFREIFGDSSILEHHCNFDFDENGEDEISKSRLSSENWDMPLIVTTNVQFFESLFSNSASRSRKMHNVANSVIILDEAQVIPPERLRPCMAALCELVINYGSTVVFCTATQPAIDFLLYPGMKPIELIDDYEWIYSSMQRVNFTNLGELSNKDLAERMQMHDQVMCIVNTRRHALDIYNMLEQNDQMYHLSANMYPAHRRRAINKIRTALANKQPCRVVSTQLIEAGVDIDFPVMYRSMAGLDSIAQAAGRCNREGKLAEGKFSMFEPRDSYRLPSSISRTIDATASALRSVSDIEKPLITEQEYPLCNRAINVYYSKLYGTEGKSGYEALDLEGSNAILPDYERDWKRMRFDFKSISDRFRFISDIEKPLIIECDESVDLIEQLRRSEHRGAVLRKLQQYSVSISECTFNELRNAGSIETLDGDTNINILIDRTKYSERYGVEMKGGEMTTLIY